MKTVLTAAVCALAILGLISSPLAAADPEQLAQDAQQKLASYASTNWVEANESGLDLAVADKPGTLFQWSYGNSFSGGPNLDEPLVTDRPDFTEASSTVGEGVLQIEFGYTYSDDQASGESSHSWGEPLFRYGMLAEWLELRVGVFPTVMETDAMGMTPASRTSGTEDLYLGFKIGLTPQEGILPEMSLIPQATVPTGSNAFTNEEFLPGVNWIYAWEVSDELMVAGSTQFNRSIDDIGEGYTEFAQSATAGLGLTDEVGAYIEWYGLFPAGAQMASVEHYLNGGFTYLLNNDMQFDIRAGTGLTSAADDFFAGIGLSVRFH